MGLVGLADPCQAGLAQDPRQAPPVILLFFLEIVFFPTPD
jgi:hypothetical protein